MNRKDLYQLHYILGRIDGLVAGVKALEIQSGLRYTRDMLEELIAKWEDAEAEASEGG